MNISRSLKHSFTHLATLLLFLANGVCNNNLASVKAASYFSLQKNFIADIVEKAGPAVVFIEIKGRSPSLLSTHTRTGFVQQQQQPPFNFGVQGQIQGQAQGQYIPSQAQIAPGQYPQPLPPQPQTQSQAAVPPSQYPQPLPPQAQAPVSKPLPVSAPEGQPGQDGLNILVPNQSQPQEPAQ
ncbi:hypothetical protein Btru_065803 [Bulinus truncatus]|nr:hypothetical protein Btru_065803 [Bulinus truncatus]